ncbi:C40 family peptidase [Robertkochia aurantiaca]|uniref:C40 family peptidase n=1 Tax=Robertkochia aurantiaca TaxID=2873700 RepID=UPI001CCA8B17|nr:C40 family peptidase [Robertkochia sp. 3YJGBD-33]
MINRNLKYMLLGASLVLSVVSCTEENKSNEAVTRIIDSIKQAEAPDKRVALFHVIAEQQPNGILLKGETNLPGAKNNLLKQLNEEQVSFIDSIRELPEAELQGKHQAVIKISAANLRGEPRHSAELVTQATLGTPVKVLKKVGGWYLVQTPDRYIAWVDDGGISLMTTEHFTTWKKAPKIIYNQQYGHSYANEQEEALVSDLVIGDVLVLKNETDAYYHVNYPDGREAFIRKNEALPFNEWIAGTSQNSEAFVSTAKKLMGLPYLWGGTSAKGVDCSGFTKTIYFANGMIIPRDASQQVHEGITIDSTGNFESLKPGDLLFFGRKATDSTPEKIVHVGMWIGDNQFIHSSGDVHISSTDSTRTNYDAYNTGRYLRSQRLLNENSQGIIRLKDSAVFIP